jgi:uncharacterized membrane protein YbhN (UPF0104 family)
MPKSPSATHRWQTVKKVLWLSGVGAVLAWSVWLLYAKLLAEVSVDPVIRQQVAEGNLWTNLVIIVSAIAHSLSQVPARAYGLAALSAVVAYAALAWYDRIALIHLNKQRGISWIYIAVCSFVTYALGHNLGASVFSGGLVRYRAYTVKGLSISEVTILVALCSFTFGFGTVMLMGAVFVYEPEIVLKLTSMVPRLDLPTFSIQLIGAGLLLLCGLYVFGSWRHFPPVNIRSFHLVYPRLPVVARQCIAAPLEIVAAAGIIHFVIPEAGHPGFMAVLGAFLLSFSAGLLSQTPGGIGVMEAVFLAIIDTVPPSDVVAALLIWRLMYLLIPLAISIPVVVAFERGQLRLTNTPKH